MLALTENATAVIGAILDRPELGDRSGLRIAATEQQGGGLTVSTADSPAESDVVIEEASARVFLEPVAAELLDDQVLDARVDDKGGVEFLLAPTEG